MGVNIVSFIHIDGHDGVGKTTLCKNIEHQLRDAFSGNDKIKVRYVKFPTEYPEDFSAVDEHYYLNDMRKTVDDIIDEQMDDRDTEISINILDRSFLSTAVYQGDGEDHVMMEIMSDGLDIFHPCVPHDTLILNLFETFVAAQGELQSFCNRMRKRAQVSPDPIDLLEFKEQHKALQKIRDIYYSADGALLRSVAQKNLGSTLVYLNELAADTIEEDVWRPVLEDYFNQLMTIQFQFGRALSKRPK